MGTKQLKIDFVVLWVDGNDPVWRNEKQYYLEQIGYPTDNRNARYRDWNNMMYWFRGIETFAPWVNKVYFVTFGHIPNWLNTECPKLQVVKHEDFIPAEYLPLFNSSAIEVNLHRIPNLSEHFVYFNDDMFLINKVRPEDFFRSGKPVTFGCFGKKISQERIMEDTYFGNLATDAEIICRLYNKRKTIMRYPFKFLNFRYGKQALCNIRTFFDDSYVLDSTHMPQAFCKRAINYVWDNCFDVMHYTSSMRFRRWDTVNQDLFKSQQVLSGNFYPQSRRLGTPLFFKNEAYLQQVIEKQLYKMCCVADDVADEQFEDAVERLRSYFHTILPNKSQFEK